MQVVEVAGVVAGPAFHLADDLVLFAVEFGESEVKLKAAGVKFVDADKPAFYKATQPIRDKYGAKYAALLKRIEDTK